MVEQSAFLFCVKPLTIAVRKKEFLLGIFFSGYPDKLTQSGFDDVKEYFVYQLYYSINCALCRLPHWSQSDAVFHKDFFNFNSVLFQDFYNMLP